MPSNDANCNEQSRLRQSQIADYQNKSIALIGYGITGKACAHYLSERGAEVSVFDKATHNKDEDDASKYLRFYSLNENTQLGDFDLVVVSPGINLQQPFIQNYIDAKQNTVSKDIHAPLIIGDIELFAREFAFMKSSIDGFSTCVVGVTGSNGKSTVVDMLTQGLREAGLRVGLGGNFGTSALVMLEQNYDVIVLELSSFQLESTYSLQLDVACILNITPDHIDRHQTMQAYVQAKRNIYAHAKHIVVNRDDPQTMPNDSVYASIEAKMRSSFGIEVPNSTCNNTTGSMYFNDNTGICVKNAAGQKEALSLSQLKQHSQAEVSQHQLLNMQVVLACSEALQTTLNFNMQDIVNSLYTYQGLAHRFETVQNDAIATWINDSKATNAGASIAAIQALIQQQKSIVLIAGGDAKGADLSEWQNVVNQHVEYTVLLGKDAKSIAASLHKCRVVDDMAAAVIAAKTYLQQSKPNEQNVANKAVILLSPACASIDMFTNYQERGDVFTQLAQQQVAA